MEDLEMPLSHVAKDQHGVVYIIILSCEYKNSAKAHKHQNADFGTMGKKSGTAARDNSEILKKIALRKLLSEDHKDANIYLAACGRGRMFSAVWQEKASYVLALDLDAGKVNHLRYHYPFVDARVADINIFQEWPSEAQFSIADFDVYGNPYRAIEHFFSSRRWSTPLLIVVTDGVPLWLARGGFLPKQFRQEQRACRLLDPRLRKTYFGTVVWPWWDDVAATYDLLINQRVLIWKKGKTVAYYAIRLVGRDSPDSNE